jgi:hypothetical protein
MSLRSQAERGRGSSWTSRRKPDTTGQCRDGSPDLCPGEDKLANHNHRTARHTMTSTESERIAAELSDVIEHRDRLVASTLVGHTIRDPEGHEWVVTETGTKGGESIVRSDLGWCYARAATLVE